jgi:hypothetical protein
MLVCMAISLYVCCRVCVKIYKGFSVRVSIGVCACVSVCVCVPCFVMFSTAAAARVSYLFFNFL